jgi:hypothetical protein
MEDTANGHLELAGLGLRDASFEVWILLDHGSEHSQGVALTKMIIKIAGSLYQP